MKKIILILAVLATTITGCKVKEAVEKFYKEKCPDSVITKLPDGKYKVALKCTDLYQTVEVKKYLSEGKITYDFVNAEVYGTVVSEDSIPDLFKILKSVSKGVKK